MEALKLVGYSIKRGVATHRYPELPVEVDEYYRGRPVLDFESCVACGACANACPAETIRIEDEEDRKVRRWTIYYGRCIFCGRCQEVCPVSAITLSREFELAAKSREDLTVEAEFKLAECAECRGSVGVTAREVELASKILQVSALRETLPELKKYLYVCERCKRRTLAENMAEALKLS